MITFAYNEENWLEDRIHLWMSQFGKFVDDFEIVLVNDGSEDRTGEIADRLAREYPQLKVIHHEKNMGTGYAARTGRNNVSKYIVFWNDVDSHFNLDDLGKVIPLLQDPEIDIVVAFKHDLIKTKSMFSWMKSRINYYLIKMLFFSLFFDYSPILDYQFVQFLPRRFFVDGIDLKSYSSFIPAECLIKARRIGLEIRQIQLKYHSKPAGYGTALNAKTIMTSIKNIFEFWLRWTIGGEKNRTIEHWHSAFGGEFPWRK